MNHWSAIKDRVVQTEQKFWKSESQSLLQNLIKQLDLMQICTFKDDNIDMCAEIKKLSPKKSTVNKRKPFQGVNFDQYLISDDQTTSIIILSKIFKQYCEFIYFKIVKCTKDNLEKTLLDEQKIFLQDKIEKFEMNNKKHNNNNMLTKKKQNYIDTLKKKIGEVEKKIGEVDGIKDELEKTNVEESMKMDLSWKK